MTKRFNLTLAALAVLTLPMPALAQETPATEKSSDVIVCELAGTCEGAAVEGAATTADPAAPVDGAAPRPRAREAVATRGFAIARPSGSSAPSPAAARPAAPRAGLAPVSQLAGSAGKSAAQISFMPGSSMMTESGKRQALQFLGALKNPLLSSKKFAVNGHTDASGSPAKNLALSKARAQAVVDYLVANGADRARLQANGYGSMRLVDAANPASPVNRRVEFVRVN